MFNISSFTSENATNLSSYSCYNCETSKYYIFSTPSLLKINSTLISNDESQLPNKALLSFIILLGTCFISVALKRFRRSNFFGRTVKDKFFFFGTKSNSIFFFSRQDKH